MSHSKSKNWIHLVIRTKYGASLITKSAESKIYQLLKTQFRKAECTVLAINGTANHIHILFLLSPKIALCNLVQRVKGASSHAINRSDLFKHKFSWSIGYGAFSVSESAISRVERYIQNQKYHHRKKTFTEEYEHFLVHHNLDLPS